MKWKRRSLVWQNSLLIHILIITQKLMDSRFHDTGSKNRNDGGKRILKKVGSIILLIREKAWWLPRFLLGKKIDN